MKKDFEIINHTADTGIIAYGADMRQAFANAARALFSLITEPDGIQELLHRDIEVTAFPLNVWKYLNIDKIILFSIW